MSDDLVKRFGPNPVAPQPRRNGVGSNIIGPRNPAREAQVPEALAPPKTDAGTFPNLKWTPMRA